jgi:ureidoglycolate lyase
MSTRRITLQPLTAKAFAPFGDVLEATGEPDKIINAGQCGRFHDLANLDFTGKDARAGISLFRSKARTLPYTLDMVERHPLGSQAFIPMSANPFMVIVAPDNDGIPGSPLAFLTSPTQGVNYHRNAWHGVLTPLIDNALFAVVDRIGTGSNLEEHTFDKPWLVCRT